MIEEDVSKLVTRLLNNGLAEFEGDLIHLTLLGRACGSSSLSFESALRLIELSKNLNVSEIHSSHMLAIIQVLDELDNIYTPIMKKGQSESIRVSEVTQRFGNKILQALQRYCHDQIQLWGRCKRAALLYDWIDGTPIETLEKRYSTPSFVGRISYGDIASIAEATRFHLRSAHQILGTLFPEQPDFLKALDEILLRLEFGLPANALPLMDIPARLTRGQYLILLSLSVHNFKELKEMDNNILRQHLGKNIVDSLHLQ
jgi:hypothetical protein